MRSNELCRLGAIATIVLSALIALPAAAMTEEEMWEICEEWMFNHEGDQEWEQSCMEAIEEWESQQPPEVILQEIKYPPAGPFPTAETAIPAGPHDGDLDAIVQALQSGPADILVEFEVSAVRDAIHAKAVEQGQLFLGDDLLAEKRVEYAKVKASGLAGVIGVVVLRDYDNLPQTFVRVLNAAALDSLLSRAQVKAVYQNKASELFLAQSLPLIEQPAAAAAGRTGANTTIAVLDTGVDFTRAPFNCTSPGNPTGCRVAATFEAAPNDGTPDDASLHGTNVSGIAASTAGAARLAVADIFNGASAFDADVNAAINWAISIRSTFNIVAMNLSFGRSNRFTGSCPSDALAPTLADALAVGIRPIAASGNAAFPGGGTFQDGISPPSCVPSAVSVGNVYDSNVGGITWCSNPSCTPPHQCTDSTTTADKIVCSSQTAPILSLLGPGAFITAAGVTQAGTSQATPHVSGAWAIMRAVSNLSEARLLTTLQEIGEPVAADTRPDPDRSTRRVDLLPEPAQLAQLAAGVLALAGLRLRRNREDRTD